MVLVAIVLALRVFFGRHRYLLTISLTVLLNTSVSATTDTIRIQEVLIPMQDGVQLAADVYMPATSARDGRHPVLLEYLPYRKTDSRARNHALYRYFLDRGYIVARVDIRGTGNSEGVTIPYEYSDIELDDGEAVIGWLAAQQWSSGKVGMFGISWGGFNAIQMAMRNPPALQAFVSLMSTEYLYQEDVHYIDGIMHTDSWMMSNDLYNSMPGAPDYVLDEDWVKNRFEAEPSVFTYMREQRDGPFWDRASAKNKYSLIKTPGYHIGGWYDGYRNSLPRMLENVSAPVKAMIGPWDHYFPHNAWPKPQVEWRHEAVRWFDHWLKGKDNGIMNEPAFAVYIRDWYPPSTDLEEIPGNWRWENKWPLERAKKQVWFAQADRSLAQSVSRPATHRSTYRPSSGLEGGGPTMWWGSLLPDQQPQDSDSLVYESEPLTEPLEILGFPLAQLNVSSTATRANWVARLSNVSPDGQVTQVSGAGFNGTHRESARKPEDLVPSQTFPIDIKMHFTSWVFPVGHRIRLAVSNSQWPMFWPTPYAMTTTLALGGQGGARVTLPVIPKGEWRTPLFKQANTEPVLTGYETLDGGNISGYAAINEIQRNAETGDAIGYARNSGAYRYPWGTERFEEKIEHRTSDVNPANTSVNGTYSLEYVLKSRVIRFEQDVDFHSDLENFYLDFYRRVLVNGDLKHQKIWKETIPRNYQ